MKARDTNRLNVLRALLTDVTNAAKTASPIKSDMQLLSLLRKRAAASKSAADEFDAAGRQDLKDKEDSQRLVMDEYAASVKTLPEQEVRKLVVNRIENMQGEGEKRDMASVLKRLLGPGGELDGKPVEKAEVAKLVKESLSRG